MPVTTLIDEISSRANSIKVERDSQGCRSSSGRITPSLAIRACEQYKVCRKQIEGRDALALSFEPDMWCACARLSMQIQRLHRLLLSFFGDNRRRAVLITEHNDHVINHPWPNGLISMRIVIRS